MLKNYETIIEALKDYRRWMSGNEEYEDKEKLQEIDKAIEEIEKLQNTPHKIY